MGTAYFYMGNYKTALSRFIKSLAIYEELDRKDLMAEALHHMGLVYYRNRDYNKAREYTLRAGQLYQRIKDTIGYSVTLSQYGNIAYDQQQYDTALTYYMRGLSYTEKLKDQSHAITSLVGIGNILFETGRHKEALVYDLRTLETAKKVNDQGSVALALLNLGGEYTALSRYDEAISVLKEAVDVSKKIGAQHHESDAYLALSEAYEKKNDFKSALAYNRLYTQYNDSIFNKENAALINSLTTKYENEKKEKAIALLNAELSDKQKRQELLNAKVKEKNITIIALVFGALLVLASAFLFFSRQRLRQKNRFQAELNKQQQNTAGAVIQMQEEERNRIARELHDGIGTFLSTLKINLQVLESNIADDRMIPYKNNSELLDKTSAELRKITRGLSNEALQENGLAHALQELTQSINTLGAMHLKFIAHDAQNRFNPLLETNLYRIAQELINNCIKHSQATKVTLQLIDHEQMVLLMLEDNGIGFDEKKRGAGMGLKNIRNRANFLGGTFKTESVLKSGSTFIVEVPKHLS